MGIGGITPRIFNIGTRLTEEELPNAHSPSRPVVPKVGGTDPWWGGGIIEMGANRYERWKGALLLSQGGASRQVVHLFL
jgi:hypothetical protein